MVLLCVVDVITGFCMINRLRLDLINSIPTNNSSHCMPITPLEDETCGSCDSSSKLIIKFLIIFLFFRTGTVLNVDKLAKPLEIQ